MSASPKASSLQIYIRLLSYVKPYRGYFALSMVGMVIFGLAQPAFAKLIDYFIQALETGTFSLIENTPWLKDNGVSAVYLLPALMILMALGRGIGSFMGNYFLAKMSHYVIHDLRNDMFGHMVRLPSAFFDNNNSGHLIARITHNVTLVTSAASEALRIVAREGLTATFLIAYLFITDWKLTLAFLAIAPVIGIVVTTASKRFRRLSHNIQTTQGELTQVTAETINGQREVRGFGGEEYEKARFNAASRQNTNQNIKMDRTGAVHTPVLQLLISISLAGLFLLVLMIKGNTSTATLVGYVTAAGLLPRPFRQLSEVNSKIQRGIAAAENIFALIDEHPEKNTGTYTTDKAEGRVEFKNIGFTYENADEAALSNISFSVEPGETVALVGRSGSGKTTLASLIPRFYDYTEGDILIDGASLNDFELGNLRSHIALVSQHITLFNGTVERNIAYGIDEDQINEEDVRLAASAAYATDFIKDLPDGMHTLIGENGVLLSGGQRQRLAIARAILKDAPILILDEATSALDTESERHIQAALDEVMKNRTTLVVAHRLSTIENADKILVMEKGRIVEQGSHAELLARGQQYAQLHQMQFRDDESAEKGEVLQPA